jgi:predicted permease
MVLGFRQKNGPLDASASIADFRDIRDQTKSVFSGMTAYQLGLDGLSTNGKAERIVTNYVPGDFFAVLGLQPAIGRLFLPAEGATPGADPVIVLGHSYWEQRFAGDASVVGTKVDVNGHPMTVVGVAPAAFHGLFAFLDTQVYLPLGMEIIEGSSPDFMTNRQFRNLNVFARLRPDTTLPQAQAVLAVVGQRLSKQYPAEDKDLGIEVYPEVRSRPNPDPKNQLAVIGSLFLGLAILVLLLACANVTNILLVRATVREREMAIRMALGAGRMSLIRQLMTESVILALAGGLAGMVLGAWASSLLGSIRLGTDLPIRLDFGVDWRVFCYAFGAALVTGLFVGIFPALRASRGNLNEVLHQSGRGVITGRNRFRNVLVMAQVGGSLMLLIVAGLFTRSLGAVQGRDLGFDPSHVLNATMDPNQIGYTTAQGQIFYDNLLRQVRAIPGVESASLANTIPMGYYGNADNPLIDGYQSPAGQPPPSAAFSVISPGYFQTLKMRMLKGRTFTDADLEDAPFVAIVNEALAKKYWPGQDALGRSFRMGSDLKHTIRVTGVVHDSRNQGIRGPIAPFFYVPLRQHYTGNSLETLQVRTAGDLNSLGPEIQRTIAALAPELPIFDVKPMSQALYTLNGLLLFQIAAGMAAALGILGLILAVVGVYGVISFAASQQTHEIGIRMALGARPASVLGMILRQGLLIVGIGLAVGVAAALAAASLVGSFLAVSPTDPLTYVSVSAILTLVALVACYVPARRAMAVDPTVALRHE